MKNYGDVLPDLPSRVYPHKDAGFDVTFLTPADDPGVLVAAAWKHYYAFEYEDMLAVAATAVAAAPYFVRGYAALAMALLELGETRPALQTAEGAALLAPRNAWAQSFLGIAFGRCGNDARARRHFQRSIALAGPNAAGAHFNYACYCAEIGAEEESRRQLAAASLYDAVAVIRTAAHDKSFQRFVNKRWFQRFLGRAMPPAAVSDGL